MKRSKKAGGMVLAGTFLSALIFGAAAFGVPSENKTDSKTNKFNEELLVGVSGTEAKLHPESETEKGKGDSRQGTEEKEDATEEENREKETDDPEREDTEAETETEIKRIETGEKNSRENSETEFVFQNGFTVAIDPGHQGAWVDMSDTEADGPGSENYKAKSTTGTTGRFTQVPEYELNLDISLALREELESRGYRVVLTREDHDTAISNSERAKLAAREGGDIYVRIHANGSDDSSVNGALAMVPSPDNPYVSNLAEDSFRLGEEILTSYCEATGFQNLDVQYYDNMSGINWSSIPVMILEMGFMTNETEDYAMQDPAMQEKMVQGIADGIDHYFEIDSKALLLEYEDALKYEMSAVEKDQKREETEKENTENKETENREKKEQEEDGQEELIQELSGPAEEIYASFLSAREELGETWSFSVEDLKTDNIYEYQASEKMQSASVVKVFIMAAVYDRMCYPSSPKELIPAGESYEGELRDLLVQMITVSDNGAANELITRLGEGDFDKGAQVVNEFCEENGYPSTSMGRAFLEENPKGDNYISAADGRKILSDIYHGTCVNEIASEKMLEILKGQTVKTKIPAGLPSGIASANKTGEMPEGYGLGCIENDMAIVFSEEGDYILTVCSNDLEGRNSEAIEVIQRMSSYVWENIPKWRSGQKKEN